MSDISEEPVRWGLIGPGRIAANVVEDLRLTDRGTLHAVASRSQDRADAFAEQHGATVAYGSYPQLLEDPDVDVVYVATPHRQHHAVALAVIAAGKHLLLEKAFTCTLAGSREVVEAAREAGVFCMEAMWTRFQPAVVRARELLADGAIGEVRAVRADLGMRTPFDAGNRLWDPAQGGGALLDLGVYPMSFVQMIFGAEPESLEVVGTLAENGVDAESTVLWREAGGRSGVAQCSLLSPLPGSAAVFGTDGWLELPPRFHHATTLRLHPAGGLGRPGDPQELDLPATGAGYFHELEEVHRCIAAGLTESPTMPLDDTLTVMAALETTMQALGVAHDEDPMEVALGTSGSP